MAFEFQNAIVLRIHENFAVEERALVSFGLQAEHVAVAAIDAGLAS